MTNLQFPTDSIQGWAVALGIVTAIMLLAWVVRSALRRKFARAAETETDLDDFLLDLVNRTRLLLLFFPAVFAGFRSVALPPRIDGGIRVAAIIAFLIQLAFWATEFADFWFRRYRRTHAGDPSAITTITAVGFIAKVVLWALIFVVALDNLGFNVTALVAGLGIGGIAVALATQNILSDLFASLSIVVDKPFVIGDSIAVDQFHGKVEYIGLKTTRLRSIDGEQLIFSNSELLKSRIRNLQRMQEKRVVFKLALGHATPDDVLAKVADIARAIIESNGGRFGGAPLLAVTPQAFEFEISYFAAASAAPAVQSAINLELLRGIRQARAVLPDADA